MPRYRESGPLRAITNATPKTATLFFSRIRPPVIPSSSPSFELSLGKRGEGASHFVQPPIQRHIRPVGVRLVAPHDTPRIAGIGQRLLIRPSFLLADVPGCAVLELERRRLCQSRVVPAFCRPEHLHRLCALPFHAREDASVALARRLLRRAPCCCARRCCCCVSIRRSDACWCRRRGLPLRSLKFGPRFLWDFGFCRGGGDRGGGI